MALKHLKIVDELTVEQAKAILSNDSMGIVMCSSKVDDSIKKLFETANVTFYDEVTTEKVGAALAEVEKQKATYMSFELIGTVQERQPDNESGIRFSFMADDIFAEVEDDKIFEIEMVHISPAYRRKGIGSMLMRQAIEQHKDKIICCSAACLMRDFPDEPTGEEYYNHLKILDEFLTKLGFVSINKLVGYEYKEAYVFNNDKAAELISKWSWKDNISFQELYTKKVRYMNENGWFVDPDENAPTLTARYNIKDTMTLYHILNDKLLLAGEIAFKNKYVMIYKTKNNEEIDYETGIRFEFDDLVSKARICLPNGFDDLC